MKIVKDKITRVEIYNATRETSYVYKEAKPAIKSFWHGKQEAKPEGFYFLGIDIDIIPLDDIPDNMLNINNRLFYKPFIRIHTCDGKETKRYFLNKKNLKLWFDNNMKGINFITL
jgi:hypothetical protein